MRVVVVLAGMCGVLGLASAEKAIKHQAPTAAAPTPHCQCDTGCTCGPVCTCDNLIKALQEGRAGFHVNAWADPDAQTDYRPGYSLGGNGTTNGLWVQKGGTGQAFGALYSTPGPGESGMAVLGFTRGTRKVLAHDFAIVADRDGVWFQIMDKDGTAHTIPATALLKLKDLTPAPDNPAVR